MTLSLDRTWVKDGHKVAAWSLACRHQLRQLKDRLTPLLSSKLKRHCAHIKTHGGR